MKNSRVSIVLATKNSLDMLRGAVESLNHQTFRDFEVVIIDGDSSDGTREFLAKQALNIRLISEPDEGISDAYAKGLHHARGDIVGILSTDERYYPHAVETAVNWFSENGNNVVCGGICRFLNEHGEEVDEYQDDFLALERHLSCEHVCSISASFFNRRLLGEELYYSAERRTCPDYEFWARMALKYDRSQFAWFPSPVIKAFRTEASTSFRDDSFREMVGDKIAYLQLFLRNNRHDSRLHQIDVNRCEAGIHMWACEQLGYINYKTPEILYHCREAHALAPNYARIADAVRRHPLLEFVDGDIVMIGEPAGETLKVERLLDHPSLVVCNDACFSQSVPMSLVTATTPWGYSLELSLESDDVSGLLTQVDQNYWLVVEMTVKKGALGIGKIATDNDLMGEQLVRRSDDIQKLFISLTPGLHKSIMIRSGGEGASEVEFHRLCLVSESVT